MTLANHSGAAVSLAAPTYNGPFKGTSTCGSTLANGSNCAYAVEFTPQVAGPASGTLAIHITGKPSLTVGLAGIGVPAGSPSALSINPGSLAFGVVAISENPSMSLTIANTSGLPSGIRSIVLSAPSEMQITGNNCPAVLSGGGSCSVSVTFTPTSAGVYSNGTLTVTETSGFATIIAVTGEGGADNGN